MHTTELPWAGAGGSVVAEQPTGASRSSVTWSPVRVSSPALVRTYWYGMTVPAVISAGSGLPVRSTCFTRSRRLSGRMLAAFTLRIRWTSVLPPVEALKPNLYVGGSSGGAGRSRTCCQPSPSWKSIWMITRGDGAGVICTFTSRLARAGSVVPNAALRVPGRVEAYLFGSAVGVVVEAR